MVMQEVRAENVSLFGLLNFEPQGVRSAYDLLDAGGRVKLRLKSGISLPDKNPVQSCPVPYESRVQCHARVVSRATQG